MSDISGHDINDEMLMAFVDGELDAAGCARVTEYVTQSAEGAVRLAAFAETGRQLAGLFDRPMQEPVPQRLIDTVINSPISSPQRQTSNVIAFGAKRPGRALFSSRSVAMAAAACAALAIAGAGFQAMLNGSATNGPQPFATADGGRVAGVELASALDGVPSGATVSRLIAGTEATIKPVFTFAAARGGYCRQYVIAQTASVSTGGVACRDAGGQWRIEAHEAFAAHRDAAGQIVVAGKDGLASVDATVDRLIAGDVLGVADEAALINGAWKQRAP